LGKLFEKGRVFPIGAIKIRQETCFKFPAFGFFEDQELLGYPLSFNFDIVNPRERSLFQKAHPGRLTLLGLSNNFLGESNGTKNNPQGRI
jgi:hypothetical protein